MKPLKVLSDLLPIPSYTVIILCFFFPFFLIKCGDTTLMSVKGTDLVTGVSKKAINERMKENLKKSSPFGSAFGNDDNTKSSDTDIEYSPLDDSKKDNENIPPNPFIIIAFLMAVTGIIVQLIKSVRKKYLYHIVFSVIGLASFLTFYCTFQSKMEGMGNNKIEMGFGSGVSISYGFGSAFYLAGVLFLIILLFYGIFSYFLKNDPEAIYGSSQSKTDS